MTTLGKSCLAMFLGLSCGALASVGMSQSQAGILVDVYKDENCGCCVGWIEHLTSHGYQATVHHPRNLDDIKEKLGIQPQLRSCHTAVAKDGFWFEGHIPAKFVDRFLANPPPGAVGLTVPGMPIGGPGMEMGNRFTPYRILLVMEDGSTTAFATVNSAADQR